MDDSEVSKDKDISFLDIFIVLARNKKLILAIMLGAVLVSSAVSLLLPPVYMAETRILPPQSGAMSLSSQLLNQYGGLASMIPGAFGLKNPIDMYIGMLKSRTVYGRIIDRFGLMQLYKTRYREEARTELDKRVAVRSGKDGILMVTVEDHDPKRAAEMANAFVVELKNLNRGLAVTEAAQRRLFFEEQLADVKKSLSESEEGFRKFQEKTGALKIDEQTKAAIAGISSLRAQIAASEVQQTVMRTYATPENPDLQRLEEESRGLKTELNKMEERGRNGHDPLMSTGRMPSVGLEYLRKLRDVKFNETLYELLAKQYELAKLDESRDASVIQVIDKAVPPEKRAKPRRTLIVALSTITAFFLSIFLVFFLEYKKNYYKQYGENNKIEELWKTIRSV
jgi:tyrosine-protein kinase Etk/Wzc